MSLNAIKLHFHSPLHIGNDKEEMDKASLIYHSDALKSALFSLGIQQYPEWAENPNSFFNGFKISSCYPFCGDELFLPRPAGLMKFTYGSTVKDETNRKQSKKIGYLSINLVSKWAKTPNDMMRIDDVNISPDGEFVFEKPENVQHIYQHEVQQRVTIDIENGGSTPFYLDRIYFEKNAGLYFLLECTDEVLKKKLFEMLHLLGESGIGTDRTVGNGLFSFNENNDVQLINLPSGNILQKKINLGLYLPEKTEIEKINFDNSSWNIMKRGGFIAAASNEEMGSLRKKNIYFFTEGSAFNTQAALNGKFVDLQPEWNEEGIHPVWRDGQPVFMSI